MTQAVSLSISAGERRQVAERRVLADHLDAHALGVGAHDLAVLRVQRRAEHHLAALAAADLQRHDHRLGHRGRAVVVRDVGDLHAGQRADHRLVLEVRLQRALADLGLVGRVRGEELRAADDPVHDAGHEVVVRARAQETAHVAQVIVLLGERLELLQHFHLGQRRRQIQRREAELLRHVPKQICHRLGADHGKHRRAVGIGVGDVVHVILRSKLRSSVIA